MCANAAALDPIPERSDAIVRNLVEGLGGVVAEIDAPSNTEKSVDALEGLIAVGEIGAIPWKDMKADLAKVILSIAKGEVKASAAQLQSIRMIIEKADAAVEDEDEVRGVVILPVIGSGSDMTLDPAWLKRVQALEIEDTE
jgi:hypothetical protein